MRTFRFIVSGSQATEEQQQTISCDLHLEPVANVSSTQPPNCTCHTEDTCINVNECADNTHDCDANASCTDTIGSYTCECDAGYSGDGLNCSNDNECTDNTDNCDANASCTDTEGSFTCSCNDGYSGDGISCNGNIFSGHSGVNRGQPKLNFFSASCVAWRCIYCYDGEYWRNMLFSQSSRN